MAEIREMAKLNCRVLHDSANREEEELQVSTLNVGVFGLLGAALAGGVALFQPGLASRSVALLLTAGFLGEVYHWRANVAPAWMNRIQERRRIADRFSAIADSLIGSAPLGSSEAMRV